MHGDWFLNTPLYRLMAAEKHIDPGEFEKLLDRYRQLVYDDASKGELYNMCNAAINRANPRIEADAATPSEGEGGGSE